MHKAHGDNGKDKDGCPKEQPQNPLAHGLGYSTAGQDCPIRHSVFSHASLAALVGF